MTDILESVESLLTTNWTAANTGSRTPIIDQSFNKGRHDIGFQDKDLILLRELEDIAKDAAAGGGMKDRVNVVIADVYTMKTRAQAVLVWKEIERIVTNNETAPFSGWDIADVTQITDRSDRSIKLWRFTLEIRFEAFTEAIS